MKQGTHRRSAAWHLPEKTAKKRAKHLHLRGSQAGLRRQVQHQVPAAWANLTVASHAGSICGVGPTGRHDPHFPRLPAVGIAASIPGPPSAATTTSKPASTPSGRCNSPPDFQEKDIVFGGGDKKLEKIIIRSRTSSLNKGDFRAV